AKLFVPAGGSVHESCGDTSAPSQVNFFAMSPPWVKLGLEMVRDMVFPPACERGEDEPGSGAMVKEKMIDEKTIDGKTINGMAHLPACGGDAKASSAGQLSWWRW